MKVKCNQCGKPIVDEFLMIGDNFLQVNFFDESDGSDNVFCSQECICEHLSVISSNIKELEKEKENGKKINKKFIDDLRKNRTILVYEFADFSKINADYFKKLRENLKLTQVVFADILGVSKKTIEKWEQGKNPIKGTASRLIHLIESDNSLISKIYKAEIITSKDNDNINIDTTETKEDSNTELYDRSNK